MVPAPTADRIAEKPATRKSAEATPAWKEEVIWAP